MYLLIAGYHCEEHNNPADFFLDVISAEALSLKHIGGFVAVFFLYITGFSVCFYADKYIILIQVTELKIKNPHVFHLPMQFSSITSR